MSRSGVPSEIALAAGWSAERLCPPSALFGANGIRFGPDGRLYVAQAFGSQISAVDPHSGDVLAVAPQGGPIIGPDDLAFDSRGTLYATEVMSARVSARTPSGEVRVVADGLPSANGITIFGDRIFIDEFRPGGRIFELFADGRAPRLLAENLMGPNALAPGPDGKLYFPQVPLGEVWRIDPDSGARERVADGLRAPPAVKFSPRGELIVPQAETGEIVRIDVQSGRKTLLAKVRPGIDNLAFDAAGRLFVSHFVDGGVAEVAMDGSNRERVLVAPGFVGPFGLAAAPDGRLHVVDGLSLAELTPEGAVRRGHHALDARSPGFVRGIACDATGMLWLSTARGDVWHSRADGTGFARCAEKVRPLAGIAAAPGGGAAVAAPRTGELLHVDRRGAIATLASGLAGPCDVESAGERGFFVSELARGRVTCVDRTGALSPLADGFEQPRGLARRGDELLVLDCGARTLTALRLADGSRRVLASALPVGAKGPVSFPGGVAVAERDGAIYVAADREGTVLRLRSETRRTP